MKWDVAGEETVLRISRRELTAINNGLNEALSALDERVFQTRMGVEVEEARSLLADFRELRVALDPEYGKFLHTARLDVEPEPKA